MLLEQVLKEIKEGKLRVPRFQRPFVWRPEQMLKLFDSIERGYPIGSLLILESNAEIPSLDKLADIEVPAPPAGETIAYLLDGHQRVSTLFGSLMRRPAGEDPAAQSEWMWQVYRELGGLQERSDRFRHWKREQEPPAHYLPMRSVLRTMDFLAYGRKLSEAVDGELVLERHLDEAEQLAHRIKSYQLAVIRLKGGGLTHAVEVFSRLNSSGQSMSPDQMVSALAYTPDGESLAERIESTRESLAPLGYGQITSITVFRSILAVSGEEDILDARWEVMATRVKGSLATSVDNTDHAIRAAVEFLREKIQVPLARLVPYQIQIVLLTAFFHCNPNPSDGQLWELERWFWGTSWSGFFAGANTTNVKISLQRMKAFAKGEVDAPWDVEMARPFPNRFDMRSARVRAFILWELRQFPAREAGSGEMIDPVKLLQVADSNAYRHVAHKTESVSHPANRLLLPTEDGYSVRSTLTGLTGDRAESFSSSHGIPADALEAIRQQRIEDFIAARARFLESSEREFMETMGIPVPLERTGEADIDTE
ncbi:DUF262 domain-containing protein [Streptomyces sp. NPDC048507]|uniref:DUF262 domain-containing protein n=1 Tax=Streptomyces sp. NPDC048507 TaxID=3365560 RepID=UPI0037231747